MQSITGYCALALTAAGLLLMPAVQAQNESPAAPSPTAPGATAAPAAIADHKLDAAAAAVKRVSGLRESFEQKLAQAPGDDKKRIVEEANIAMSKAVTDQGLSLDEFETIMKVAQNDPVVRGKLLQRLE